MKDKDTDQEFHFFVNRWLRKTIEDVEAKEEGTEKGDTSKDDKKDKKEEGKEEKEESSSEMDSMMIELPAIRPDIPPPKGMCIGQICTHRRKQYYVQCLKICGNVVQTLLLCYGFCISPKRFYQRVITLSYLIATRISNYSASRILYHRASLWLAVLCYKHVSIL